MVKELTKLGAHVTEHPDGMEIVGGKALTGNELESYDDHRIAMSLAIAALVAKGKTSINRAESAAISYPSFIPTLQSLYSK
jgi:3-phosphoshikimate 1-carboxyvinyltransferase